MSTAAHRRNAVLLVAVAVVVAVGAVLVAGSALRGGPGGSPGGSPVGTAAGDGATSQADGPSATATASAAAPSSTPSPVQPSPRTPEQRLSDFLDTSVDPDGRVVRRDQGGDTVSEGQAYGMLVAVAAGREETFGRIWSWSQEELLQPDGLMAWRWDDGSVTDVSSATDADLDAAQALVAAADLFDREDWREDGLALAGAVLDRTSVVTPSGRLLTAGSWVSGAPWTLNPSYFSPQAAQLLGAASGDPRWEEVDDADGALVADLLDDAALPPDWALVDATGAVAALPGPAVARDAPDGGVRYSLDAARVPVRLAVSCDEEDREVAARFRGVLERPLDEVRGAYDLGGGAVVEWRHPLQLVSLAGARAAAGDADAARAALDAADVLDQQQPTYYGAAWVALGTALLELDTPLAATDCPPGPPLPARAR